jgi:hypothetical protein
MAKQKNRFNIAEQERSVIAALTKLNDQKQELLARLADGDDVSDEINSLAKDIADYEAKLKLYADARVAREAANSEGARKARHDGNVAKVKSAREKGKQLVNLSVGVVKAIGALGKQLEEIEAVRNDFVGELRDVLLSTRECEAGKVSQRQVTDGHEIVFNVADVLTLSTYFQAALYNARVGVIGIRAQGVEIARVPPPDHDHGSTFSDPTEAIERALARLDRVIGQVSDISERANAAKAA